MKNKEIARTFAEIADLLEILGEGPFRVNSYRRSARVIEELTEDIEELAEADRLEQIPGIGRSTAGKIREYLQTGKVAMHQELLGQVPPKLIELLGVPGLGPKTVAKLWQEADVKSVEELRVALDGDRERLTQIGGLGPKKIEQISESLAFMASSAGRIRLGEAEALAEELMAAVRRARGVKRIMPAGSLRRGRETIGDIDLLCEATQAAAPKIIGRFAGAPNIQRVLAKGKTKGSIVTQDGTQADLRVVPGKSFGAALAYFTGSKAHNIRLRELAQSRKMKLNEYGLFRGDKQVAGVEEEDIFRALGLPFVPPELREDRGEVEAARADKLPDLLELSDIRGDLHMHTNASDGANTIEEMIQACRQRGYQYMVIADHSKSQIQANGLDEKRLAEHAKAIRAAAAKFDDITVWTGIEVDVFKDGRLDFGTDVLAELDFVTASAHTALGMTGTAATDRLIRAIEHPHVHCLGHATGRIINARPGMEIDIEAVAAAAAANHVALEINAHYMRLDLRDIHVRAAIEAGAKIAINTDAHAIADLDLMRYGAITARRGWATAADVVNTWTAQQIRKWLRQEG